MDNMVVYQMSAVTKGKRRLVIEQSPDDQQADAKTTNAQHAIGDSAARMQEDHDHHELASNGVPSYLYPPLTDPNFNVAIVLMTALGVLYPQDGSPVL